MFHVVVGVFYFCDLVDMLEADRAVENMTWLAGAHFDAGRLFQKVRGGRGFCDKVKGAIWAHVYGGWNWCSRGYVGCTGVELFAKVHRLDTASTQCGTDWRCWRGFSRTNEETLNRRM